MKLMVCKIEWKKEEEEEEVESNAACMQLVRYPVETEMMLSPIEDINPMNQSARIEIDESAVYWFQPGEPIPRYAHFNRLGRAYIHIRGVCAHCLTID